MTKKGGKEEEEEEEEERLYLPKARFPGFRKEKGEQKNPFSFPSPPPLPVRQNKFMVAEEEEVGSLAHFFCLVSSSPQRWFDLEERGKDPRRSENQRIFLLFCTAYCH